MPLVNPWQRYRGSGGNDMFLAAFDPAGAVPFSTYFGGVGNELVGGGDTAGLTVDPAGNVYLVGCTSSPELATPGAFQTVNPTAVLDRSGFIAKFSALASNAAATVRTPCASPAPTDSLRGVTGPVLGQTLTVALGDPSGGQFLTPGNTAAIWLISTAPDPNYPCGSSLPGFGEALISLAPPPVVAIGTLWGSTTAPSHYSVWVPKDPSLDGSLLFTQGVLYDLAVGKLVFTEALDLRLGK